MPARKVASQEKRSYMDMLDPAMELIGSREGGILQSDLWKHLNIDRSKCSKIVSTLERLGLIERSPISRGGIRTYLIRQIGASERVSRLEDNRFFERYIDTYLTEIYLLYLVESARVSLGQSSP
jgi:predicted transcriptional regulator of viral defense system